MKNIPPHITTVNLLANPLSDELGENTKKEIFFALPHFIKINKSELDLKEKAEFEQEWKEK